MAKLKHISDYSEYEKLQGFLETFKTILNENICDQFLMCVNRYIEEERLKERSKVVSPELQQIEALIDDYQRAVKDNSPMDKYYLHHIQERIIKLYGKA